MKCTIAIIGSRTFNNHRLLQTTVDNYIKDNDITEVTIVSGGAKGADTIGAKYAEFNDYKLIVHEADWKDLTQPGARIKTNQYGKYNANAGHYRNTLIINDADVVIAFTNGSPGTANSIHKAKKAGKPVNIVNF